MARAVLQIDVDTSNITRAMGDIRGVARSAQAAMTAEARSAARDRDRVAREEAQAKKRADAEALRAKRKAENDATKAAEKEARDRAKIADREARETKSAADRAARDHTAAERRKTRDADREEKQRTRAAEREERKRTATVEREARQRANAERHARNRTATLLASGAVNTGVAAGRAVGAFAMGSHGMIQDARRERAMANRNLTYALSGAGIRGFGGEAQRIVAQFTRDTGMNYGDVVGALLTGQQRGSALELRGRTPETALRSALDVVRQANATGADGGQLLAARGRLSSAGITGSTLDDLVRFSQFAADRGSVEVDAIIQQGLPGALRLMSSRTGPMANASAEERQRIAAAAFRESVATQEVMAGAGGRAGQVSSAYSAFQTALDTPRRHDLMRENLRNYARSLTGTDAETQARRAAVTSLLQGPNAIFEDDPARRGQQRLRAEYSNSPLALLDRVTAATGGNANAAANIFAGGGHGNAQGLLSNLRILFGALGSINPETGRPRSETVRDIMRGGYTQADIDERKRAVEGDDLAAQNRVQEERAQALTDHTSAMVRFSNSVNDFLQRNPFGTQAASSGAGFLGGITAGVGIPMLRNALAGMFGFSTGAAGAAAGASSSASTVATAARALPALLGGGGLAAKAIVGVAGTVIGAGIGSAANQAIYSDRGNSNGGGPAYTNAFSGDFWRGAATSIVQAFETAGATGRLRVTIDPHDVQHARSGTPAPVR